MTHNPNYYVFNKATSFENEIGKHMITNRTLAPPRCATQRTTPRPRNPFAAQHETSNTVEHFDFHFRKRLREDIVDSMYWDSVNMNNMIQYDMI